MDKRLDPEFTHHVDWSVTQLGQVIQSELGKKAFHRIENIRHYVKTPTGGSLRGLIRLKNKLSQLDPQEQFYIAHSFALMLELINACEAAFRIHRLRQKPSFTSGKSKGRSEGRIIHVLTAHPTESRNTATVFYFKKIQNILLKQLENPSLNFTDELFQSIKLAWKTPVSKQRKPSVMDEAQYIYSLALQDEIMKVYVQQRRSRVPFFIRTWVGGDKDGHPGVDEKSMLGSLEQSRTLLLKWVIQQMTMFMEEMRPLSTSSLTDKRKIQEILRKSQSLKNMSAGLKVIRSRDSHRVHAFKNRFEEVQNSFEKNLGGVSENLSSIRDILRIFPGLVVPLELREDAALVHEALKNIKGKYNISRMLRALAKLSPGHDPRFYVRGFVLSQTESSKDILAGIRLSEKFLGRANLPIVPLFESAHSLKNSVAIIDELLQSKDVCSLARTRWSGQIEIMLGYSDSAKENGSFPSRFLIDSAIMGLEKVIKRKKLKPIFFHGSGGSIERGGGSIQEQTAWWPLSALESVKMTIQGEVVYRNYIASELLLRHLELINKAQSERRKSKGATINPLVRKDLTKLSDFIQDSYRSMLENSDFLEVIEHATPYSFLKDVRLGSRPSKRQGAVQIKNLRAIPWVLCWTQTRAFFPSWWGVGSYWNTLNHLEKNDLRKAFQQSSLFSSYIKAVGFTLAKMELDIFSLYLHASKLPKATIENIEGKFRKEFALCKQCVHELTREKSLIWYRPWLETSIALRSPLIHPMNVLQIIALETKDVLLLRETLTGVASGMLTTG